MVAYFVFLLDFWGASIGGKKGEVDKAFFLYEVVKGSLFCKNTFRWGEGKKVVRGRRGGMVYNRKKKGGGKKKLLKGKHRKQDR